MQDSIDFNFSDVYEYRKAVGTVMLSEMCNNFRESHFKWLEIGPGRSSSLVRQLSLLSDGSGQYFVEPDLDAIEHLKRCLPRSSIFGSKIENAIAGLPSAYFDFVYSNFSLHWALDIDHVIYGLHKSLVKQGLFGLAITDQDRSFWRVVNDELKLNLPGCDLFKSGEVKTLDVRGWKRIIESHGFLIVKDITISGVSSVASNWSSALQDLKVATKERYLKLANGISMEAAEETIKEILVRFSKADGSIEIPASGRILVCKKSLAV